MLQRTLISLVLLGLAALLLIFSGYALSRLYPAGGSVGAVGGIWRFPKGRL